MPHNEKGEIINDPVSVQERPYTREERPQSSSSSWLVIIIVVVGLVCLISITSSGLSGIAILSANISSPTEPFINNPIPTEIDTYQSSHPLDSTTLIPTRTPAIAKAVSTPTTKVSSCPGAPKQRLETNEDAEVCTKKDSVFIRSGPGKSYSTIKKVGPGTVVWVLDGPKCLDNWSWWKVELPDNTVGWMAEGGDNIDSYFLCPN